MKQAHRQTPSGKTRARGAGVPFVGTPGEFNAITDVPGVEVGYQTLIRGHGPLVVGQGPVRTGVTAIFPRGYANPEGAAYAGFFNMSGNGEMSGAAFIEERGRFDGPITITNTHSCGLTRDVTAKWLYSRHNSAEKVDQPFYLPVSAETHDGPLNDINGHHVTEADVIAAFEDARGGWIEEGSVGGGTGMRCFEFKGGSGTASRVYPNPAAHGFWLDAPALGGRVSLVDAQGRILRSWERGANAQEFFELGSLSAGWYVVVLERNGVVERHPLQIQP